MRNAIIVLAFTCTLARAQSPPAFEVATIKPSDPDRCCSRTFSHQGRRFASYNTTLRYLLQYAYDLQPRQIEGGPAWFDQDRFDITGLIEGDTAPTDRQWKLALQTLLTGRFHLQVHRETRELSVYALVVAKGGPRLTLSSGDPTREESVTFAGQLGAPMQGLARNATLADFAGEMQRVVLDRPVVDRTELPGVYNILLTFTREDTQALGMTQLPDTAPPDIFTALQQQLGLKLERTRAPVTVLILDQAEKPTAN